MKEGDLRRYEPLIYGKLKGLETSRRLTDQGWNKISLEMVSSLLLEAFKLGKETREINTE